MSITALYQLYLQHPVVCTDTRKIEKECLFFALKGPNFNANSFAKEALQKGAAAAVIDEEAFKTDDRYILVDDVLATLQELAKHHRQQLGIPVIAIVGSNGKTTTKELITSVLAQRYKVLATPGNFNNHIGLPLTLLQLRKEHELAIIEMGANHVGENAALCEIACPDFGLVTNNGKDHLEGFGDMEGVARSNSELYYYLQQHEGLAFVNANDEWLMRMASRLKTKVTYAANDAARNAKADHIGTATSLRPRIIFSFDGASGVESSLSGDYNFDNIMGAVAIGLHFKVDAAAIGRGISSYEPKNNRSQVIQKKHNTIYMDAYNANPSSMEASLRNFAALEVPNKIAILGDMFEMGKFAAEEHANMIRLCKQLNLAVVILVGEEFDKQNKGTDFRSFKTTADAITYIASKKPEGASIFMKGSRGMKLETIAEAIN